MLSVFEDTSRHHLEIEEGEKKYGKKDCTEQGVQHLRQTMHNLEFLIYLIVVQYMVVLQNYFCL